MSTVCARICCVVLVSLQFNVLRAEEASPSFLWAEAQEASDTIQPASAADCPPEMPYTSTDPNQVLGAQAGTAPTFPWLSRSFSAFRSPASYGMEYWERCPSSPWTPRGLGVARRSSAYRMDYKPYQLKSNYSTQGPAFYPRIEMPPCCGLDCGGCNSCFWDWYCH